MGTLKVNGNIESQNASKDCTLSILNGSNIVMTLSNYNGGWASGHYFDVNNARLGGFGVYGTHEKAQYFFAGASYSSPWMKVMPDGTITATKFVGSLEGNADTASKLVLQGKITSVENVDAFLHNGLSYFHAGSSATTLANDGNIIAILNSAGWGSQLWIDDGSGKGGLAVRSRKNTTTWNDWVKILDSNNYTSYALPLSGGTMTGDILFTNKGLLLKAGNSDQYLWKIYSSTDGSYGFRLQYNGSGGGDDNSLSLFADNQEGTEIEAIEIKQSGAIHLAKNVNCAGTITASSFSGNASSAPKLAAPRTISLTGSVTGSGSFDGSGNLSITTTTNHTHDDTKVTQSRSTSTSWRALLSHYTAVAQGTNPEAATNVVYYNEKASIQPSTGKIYSAGGFIGNADTATKLKTARTISLTGSVTGSGSFDGSGNLSISTTTNHSHSYLPLSGGNMTGQLSISMDTTGTNPGGQNIILNGKPDSTSVSNAPGLAMHIANRNYSSLKYLYDGSWRFYNSTCDGYVPIFCSKTIISNYGGALPSSGDVGEVFYKLV